MFPTGSIVYTSEEVEAIGYIFYNNPNVSKFKQMKDLVINMVKLTSMTKYISMKEFIFFSKSIYNNSSAWIEEVVDGDFIHLDLIVVVEKYRNKGLAKVIIQDTFTKADKENLIVTLETQNPENVKIYEYLGFEVVKEQPYKDLIQYCMIRKPNTK
ncbi:MAG: GNAT family N-acetyltransferase [Peptostreptococcaceae bacterium]